MTNTNNVTKKKGGGRISPAFFLLLLAAVCLYVVLVVFRTDHVTIEGNSIYEETELKELLLAPEHSGNALYLWYYYKFRYDGEIPFVDSVNVDIEAPGNVILRVAEEESIGYIVYADSRAYFDRSGTVVELSDRVLSGVITLIEGEDFDPQVVEENEKLPVEEQTLLQSILTVCRELQRLNMPVDLLYFDQKGMLTLTAGTIRVALGAGEHLEDKISLAKVLLEKLEGKTGVLHLEDYDGTSGTRSFQETESENTASEDADSGEEPADTGDENSGYGDETPDWEATDADEDEYSEEYDEYQYEDYEDSDEYYE